LAAQGMSGLELMARNSLEMAERAVEKLADIGLHPTRNPLSIMVNFDRPAEWICRKYHLATVGDRARVVTVSHVRKQVIDEMCHDIATEGH
jgi:histidine decarboxylase